MAGDIVLGYDGSEGSKAALAVAITVSRAFNATLAIVFGFEPNPMGGETADYKAQLEKLGSGVVSAALAEAKQLDGEVVVEAVVVPLRPVESLLAAAEQREARVIVVGGNSERPIMGAILGSVPHKLLHRASVPVLVVPAPEQ